MYNIEVLQQKLNALLNEHYSPDNTLKTKSSEYSFQTGFIVQKEFIEDMSNEDILNEYSKEIDNCIRSIEQYYFVDALPTFKIIDLGISYRFTLMLE